MSSRLQPDRRSGNDRRGRVTPANAGWLSENVLVTRGLVLAIVIVSFAFVGFGTWAAVRTVHSLREDDCDFANERRAQLRELGHDLVDNDRFLIMLADSLSEDGLPAEFIDPLEQRWAQQDAEIDVAYAQAPCD